MKGAQMVKVKEAAARLSVTPTTVRRWIKARKLKAARIGQRLWLVDIDSLLQQAYRANEEEIERSSQIGQPRIVQGLRTNRKEATVNQNPLNTCRGKPSNASDSERSASTA